MAVRGVVVHGQMQAELLRGAAVDEPQELESLAVAVPRLAQRDYAAVQCIQRCKQRDRSVPFVVVGHGAGAPAFHEQARLRTVQCLDLALLVAT